MDYLYRFHDSYYYIYESLSLFLNKKLFFAKGFDYDKEIIQSYLSLRSIRFNYSRICVTAEGHFEDD
jgi:hypothetical protein